MQDNEQDRGKKEVSDQWQVNIEDWKLERVFQQELTVRYRASRDDR